MKEPSNRALQRAMSLMLCILMLFSIIVQAVPVQAEEAAVQQEQPLVAFQVDYANQQVGEAISNGDVVPNWSSSSDAIVLCRGSFDSPLRKDETSVQLISHATGEPIPENVLQATVVSSDYARYTISLKDSNAAEDYFASVSPEFGFDVVFTTTSGETFTVSIPNDDIEIVPSSTFLRAECIGPDKYSVNIGYLELRGEALKGFPFSPTIEWFAKDFSLSGQIAEYFTVKSYKKNTIDLAPTEKLESLPLYTQLNGELNWTNKLNGQTDSLPLQYMHSGFSASWYQCSSSELNNWQVPMTVKLEAGQRGSFYLRLYPSNLPPVNGGEPFSLSDAIITKDLPANISVTPMADGTTLLLQYDLKNSDARSQPYTIKATLPGMYYPATLFITVKGGVSYEIGRISGDGYSYTSNSTGWPENMRTLLEDFVVVPIVNGQLPTTREQLETSGIAVQDSVDPSLLRITPRQITYTDKNYTTQQVWAFCITPIAQKSEFPSPPNPSASRVMNIQYNGQVVGWMRYNIEGCDDPTSSRDIVIQADRLETPSIGSTVGIGLLRYTFFDQNKQPLPVVKAPTVTGTAAQNIANVEWAEGVAGVRVDFAENQISGQAIVEVDCGSKVFKLVYDFKDFKPSVTYYSLGTDYLYRPYAQALFFIEDLADLNPESMKAVQTTRFIEDGGFQLYIGGSQRMSEKNLATTDELWPPYYSFGAELVKNITFTSSDEEILRIESQIDHTSLVDNAFPGNGYSNPDGKCYGINLVPGGKTGSCDVYATIELNIPSKSDPFGCNTELTPTTVKIGHTFTVRSNSVFVEANPENLQQVLDEIEIQPSPVLVLLEGGTYAMDLNLAGKNVILRSKDPENPAVFTGTPGQEGGFIITVDSPSPDFALEDLVIDGGGVRGGIQHVPYMGQLQNQFSIRRCVVQNCTNGVKGHDVRLCRLYNTTIQNCQQGVEFASLYSCTLQHNQYAIIENYLNEYSIDYNSRWSIFANNEIDICYFTRPLGTSNFTIDLPQNYWDGNSAPKVLVLNRDNGKPLHNATVKCYTSPYYVDLELSRLNVDLGTTKIENDTLLLPLEQSDEQRVSLKVEASAFAEIQKSNKNSSFPIFNEKGERFAQWDFTTIQRTDIDTDLQVDNELSQQAQDTVDKLPQEDQDKILQEVNLSHNGDLPGRTTLRIKADEIPDEGIEGLYLYWVKPDGTIVEAEVVDVRYDAAEKCYIIVVDHCSEYIITSGRLSEDTSLPTPTPAPQPTSVPTSTPVPTDVPQPTVAPTGTPNNNFASQPSSGQSELYSAQQVIDAFEKQQGIVVLDTKTRSKVSQKAFELLKERPDTSLSLKGDGYTWTFTGSNIQSSELPNGVFDAAVALFVSDSAKQRINAFANGSAWQGFETAFSGVLPGPAELQLTMPDLAGTKCGLYLLPDTGDAEYISSVNVDAQGQVILSLEHCSVYFLMVEQELETEQPVSTPVPETTPSPETTTVPSSSSNISMIFIATIAAGIVCIAAVIVILIRRVKSR